MYCIMDDIAQDIAWMQYAEYIYVFANVRVVLPFCYWSIE
jgi:hypothetical protein